MTRMTRMTSVTDREKKRRHARHPLSFTLSGPRGRADDYPRALDAGFMDLMFGGRLRA